MTNVTPNHYYRRRPPPESPGHFLTSRVKQF